MRALLVLLLVLAASGCVRRATQLVPVVDSDLTPDLIRCVALEVGPVSSTGAFEGTSGVRLFYVDEGSTGLPRVTLPFSLGVTPPNGDARARVEIHARALSQCSEHPTASEVVVTRIVRTGFVAEQALTLPIFLSANCRDVMCPMEGTTCVDGRCVSSDVPTSSLMSDVPGMELRPRDSGPRVDAGEALDVGSDAALDATVPRDAFTPSGGVPAPTRVEEVLSPTGGTFGGFAVNESTGALIAGITQGANMSPLGLPMSATPAARVFTYEGGTATPLATWTVAGMTNIPMGIRTRGSDIYLCITASAALTGMPNVPAGSVLFAKVDSSGALRWAHRITNVGTTLACNDFEVLVDGSLVAALNSTVASVRALTYQWDGVAIPDAVFGGLAVLADPAAMPPVTSSGGSYLTVRVADRTDHGELTHARFYHQTSALLVEATSDGYAVSGYTGRSLMEDWGSETPTSRFGGTLTQFALARYAIDDAAPTGERFLVGNSATSLAYSTGRSPANIVSLGTRLYAVSSAARDPVYSTYGLFGCATLPDNRLPAAYIVEFDAMNGCLASPQRLAQLSSTDLRARGFGSHDLFVFGALNNAGSAMPQSFLGAPDLSFTETRLGVLANYDAELVPRWHVEVRGAPSTISSIQVLPDGRTLWVRGTVSGTGTLLGMPVTNSFLARISSP